MTRFVIATNPMPRSIEDARHQLKHLQADFDRRILGGEYLDDRAHLRANLADLKRWITTWESGRDPVTGRAR